MHEAAVARALWEEVRRHLPEGGRLLRVAVEVGELEHVEADTLRTHFVAQAEGTPLEGAELELTRVPLRVRCRTCGAIHRPPDPALLLCPECDAVRPEVLEGGGILLRSLEVET